MSKYTDPISGRDLLDAVVSSGNEARAEVIRLKKEVFAVSCELNASIQHVELLKKRQAVFDALLEAAATLLDYQNGPPLPTWEKPWKKACDTLRDAIKAAEGAK